MATITVTLDNILNADYSNIAEVSAEITAVQNAFDDTFSMAVTTDDEGRIVFRGNVPGTKAAAPEGNTEPVTRVVEVNGQYTYLLYVDDHGDVRVGGRVDVEAQHGGHWNGKVTHVYDSVERYTKQEGRDEPTLMVLEVIDPGPIA